MTYRFKCRATRDVLLLHPDGNALLRIMGRDPTARGIITPAALPAAIAAIERARAVEVDRQGLPEPILQQQARPLLKLLRQAQATADEVVWGD